MQNLVSARKCRFDSDHPHQSARRADPLATRNAQQADLGSPLELPAVSSGTFSVSHSAPLAGSARSGSAQIPSVEGHPQSVTDWEILSGRIADLAAVGGTAHKLAQRIRSGTVWINCHNVFDTALPFGGYKQSGWGREMGEEVSHNYTEIKAVTAAL